MSKRLLHQSLPGSELPLAIPNGNSDLCLWAESPNEARQFLRRVHESGRDIRPKNIFVAKTSGKSRSNKYTDGQYYITCNSHRLDVYNSVVRAPKSIRDLVQWCTCDAMLTLGEKPIVVFEDTTHVVRMNLYQRIPRLLRAAECRVPSLMLQGTRGLDFSKPGDNWALRRYLSAFASMANIYPHYPPLPFRYLAEPDAEILAQAAAMQYVQDLLNDKTEAVAKTRDQVITGIRTLLASGEDKLKPPPLPCIVNNLENVVVRIGARPERKSWDTKGSGQMDPYLGLIAAAKCIYCYDSSGKKVKSLVVEFTHIPPGFKFFAQGIASKSLYKRLVFELADEVKFYGRDPH